MRWDEFLALPVFIINLDRRYVERYDECLRRVKAAGFIDIRRWQAVDAASVDLEAHWAQHGSPLMNQSDEEFCVSYKGKQGCFLSHVHLLKYAIGAGMKNFIVFEDDILFHPEWEIFSPLFLEATFTERPVPDLVYLGAQIEVPQTSQRVVRAPCFCTHAMLITNPECIYRAIINMPGGVRTIDCCLIDYEWAMLQNPSLRIFNWVCWDSRGLAPSTTGQNPGWTKRNCGLVFQDEAYGSDVRPWP